LEPREKVELFRSYYLASLRTFEQDPQSPTYLDPLSIYMIVFRHGILTFHCSPTPHPPNVRRRIRQLKDYIQVSTDWICYALIDDIVDGFAPLLEGVEQEVDAIDEGVLNLHRPDENLDSGQMLQRIGLARKKVMGLLRLLGSKADVIKGFSKRCNEKWEIAPRSEIGLYLGDIQGNYLHRGGLMEITL
jgi:magnesium transporter